MDGISNQDGNDAGTDLKITRRPDFATTLKSFKGTVIAMSQPVWP
jgi:hypothetical protein